MVLTAIKESSFKSERQLAWSVQDQNRIGTVSNISIAVHVLVIFDVCTLQEGNYSLHSSVGVFLA